MKKLLLLAGVIFISGCLTTRTYTKKEPRKDLDIEGNQGCLSGVCKEEPRENRLGDTRTISVVEVEFGPEEIKKDATVWERVPDEAAEEEIALAEAEGLEAASLKEPAEGGRKETINYTIQKNDTLQKISDKFYGTTRKWNFLYENNKDVLKSPDRLYPGAVIKIPPAE